MTQAEAIRIKQERDELLRALKQLLDCGDGEGRVHARQNARALIVRLGLENIGGTR